MPDSGTFPNYQNDPAGAIPVYVTAGPGGGGAPPYAFTPKGYQQITSGTLAVATALTVPSGAKFAYISVSGGAVRYRDDGTAPTASVGYPYTPGAAILFQGAAVLAAAEFIAQTGGSPTLDVLYYS